MEDVHPQSRQMEHNAFSWREILSHRVELFGISALWIIALHLQQYVPGFPAGGFWTAVRAVMKMGNAGVDVFILLSAIGLWHSMERNSVRDFYLHRLRRALVSWLIIGGVYLALRCVDDHRGPLDWLLDVSLISWWFDPTTLWYPFFMLVTYLVFPLLFFAKKRIGGWFLWALALLSAVGVVLAELLLKNGLSHRHELVLSRLPVFLTGTVMAETWLHRGEIRLKHHAAALVVLLALSALYLWGPAAGLISLKRWIKALIMMYILLVCAAFAGTWQTGRIGQALTAGLKWVGVRSFEIYLTHQVLITLLDSLDRWKQLPMLCWYAGVIVCSFLASGVIWRINGWVLSRLDKRKETKA